MSSLKILMVEGGDDQMVVEKLLERRKISFKDFEIKNHQGLSNLLKTLPNTLTFASYETIGIIVDADEDIKQRWQDLRDIAQNAGYKNIPSSPNPKGTILKEEGLSTLGIWIMPNNSDKGILEDFIQYLVSPEDDLLPIATAKVEELLNSGKARFKLPKKQKAIIHTWLAWQSRPELSLGMAITHECILNDKKGTDFINWLKKLFGS